MAYSLADPLSSSATLVILAPGFPAKEEIDEHTGLRPFPQHTEGVGCLTTRDFRTKQSCAGDCALI